MDKTHVSCSIEPDLSEHTTYTYSCVYIYEATPLPFQHCPEAKEALKAPSSAVKFYGVIIFLFIAHFMILYNVQSRTIIIRDTGQTGCENIMIIISQSVI